MKPFPQARAAVAALVVCALAGGALAGAAPAAAATTTYAETRLIGSRADLGAAVTDPNLVNAWGIAIRHAGFGGHFWITANGTGQSSQWIGDVNGVPLFQDALATVTVPGPGGDAGTPTGVAFNGGSGFAITQGDITNSPAKFLFGTDNGVISAWTERKNADGSFTWPGEALAVVDRSADGVQFFGVGVHGASQRLYAANFGTNPGLLVYDGSFADISATAGFANPFVADGYQPFNVQVLGESVFVLYAKWGTPGEEETGDGMGRVAEFAPDGTLLRIWGGGQGGQGIGSGLNAPWGVAIAPSDFGTYAHHLLVGNFGDGTIAALDPTSGTFVDWLRDAAGNPIAIEGLWGLQFGNGASLGQADRLYYAAGPEDETQGLFGYLATTQVSEPGALALAALALCLAQIRGARLSRRPGHKGG